MLLKRKELISNWVIIQELVTLNKELAIKIFIKTTANLERWEVALPVRIVTSKLGIKG